MAPVLNQVREPAGVIWMHFIYLEWFNMEKDDTPTWLVLRVAPSFCEIYAMTSVLFISCPLSYCSRSAWPCRNSSWWWFLARRGVRSFRVCWDLIRKTSYMFDPTCEIRGWFITNDLKFMLPIVHQNCVKLTFLSYGHVWLINAKALHIGEMLSYLWKICRS